MNIEEEKPPKIVRPKEKDCGSSKWTLHKQTGPNICNIFFLMLSQWKCISNFFFNSRLHYKIQNFLYVIIMKLFLSFFSDVAGKFEKKLHMIKIKNLHQKTTTMINIHIYIKKNWRGKVQKVRFIKKIPVVFIYIWWLYYIYNSFWKKILKIIGICYLVLERFMTWTGARDACRREGHRADLASINSKQDQNFIQCEF